MKIRLAATSICLCLLLGGCRSEGTSQTSSAKTSPQPTTIARSVDRTTDRTGDIANNRPNDRTGDRTMDSIVSSTKISTSKSVLDPPAIATAVGAQRTWVQETIGPTDAASYGLTSLTFAPDGRAVAFSVFDQSCCSNGVSGWARDASGNWTTIAKTQETFVQSSDGSGAMGGPESVAFFKDRFVAIGRRGAILDVENSSKVTTWTSRDGLRWTAISDPDNADNAVVGLLPSLDGSSLVGAWSTGSNVHLRSTVDGETWTEFGHIDTSSIGTYAYVRSISTQTVNGKEQYVAIGTVESLDTKLDKLASTAFVATSPDGRSWKSFVLENTTGQPSAVASGVAVLNGALFIYGDGYGDSSETTVATAWRATDGVTFDPLTVTGCNGRFVSPTFDPADATPRIVAICSVPDGPIEGDVLFDRTEVLASADGIAFAPIDDAPSAWGSPSTDVALGPVTVDHGSLVIGVGDTRLGNTGSVSIWRR